MKRWLFSLLFVAVGVFVAMWLWQMPQRVVRSELHPLYLRYEHCPDVAAGFVKNLRIADSVTIDAVTLQAKDTATWFRLLEELQVDKVQIALLKKNVGEDMPGFTIYNTPKVQYNGSKLEYDVVVCMPMDISVCIYDVQNHKQDSVLIERCIDKILNIQTNEKDD